MSDTWTCDCCGGIFLKNPDFSEEEKLAEMRANVGEIPEDDRASVCDDCYAAILPGHPTDKECAPGSRVIVFGTPHHRQDFYGDLAAGGGLIPLVPDPGTVYDRLAARKALPNREELKELSKYHEEHPFDPIGEHRALVEGPEPGSHFEGVCQVFDDTVEVPVNPEKAFQIKNTAQGDVFMFQEKAMEAVCEVIARHHARLEAVAKAWFAAGSPGAHPGELVMEYHQTLDPTITSRTVFRVKAGPYWEGGGAGPVLFEVLGIKLRMVED